MAAFLNKVYLIGNLTKDPIMRFTTSGMPVATLRIAVNRRYKTQSGDLKEEANYFNVVAWGKIAENCNKYLSKGKSILVEGRLTTRSFEMQDGQKRNVVEIVAENIQFLTTQSERADTAEISDIPSEYSDGEPFEGDDELNSKGYNSKDSEEVPF